MFRLVAQFRRSWPRRLLVVLASVVVLVGQIGLPVQVRVKKDKSRPFLCMDRACGCHSAEACWKNCCCHSKAERVAWAKRHHVEIPRDWGEPDEDKTPAVAARCEHEDSADETLCGSPAAIRELTSKSCCSKSSGQCDHQRAERLAKSNAESSQAESEETDETGWLSWEQFRQCRGAPSVWSVNVDSLPPPPAIELIAADVSRSYPVIMPVSLVSIELDPPVPPPKIG